MSVSFAAHKRVHMKDIISDVFLLHGFYGEDMGGNDESE